MGMSVLSVSVDIVVDDAFVCLVVVEDVLDLGSVHTNPFLNENGVVLLRFRKDLRPHLSFSYRFRPSTLQRRICLKTLLYPQCAWSNELDACAFQYIGSRNWREFETTW